MKQELMIFLVAVLMLTGAILVYTATALPEMIEYNERLSTLNEQIEECDCLSICDGTTFQYLETD